MEPNDLPPAQRTDTVDVVRVLVLLQGAALVLSTVEVALWGLLTAAIALLAPTIALTAAAAAFQLRLAASLGRRRRRARRLVLAVEAVLLVLALVDLGLSLAITHRPLALVPLLMRVALPIAVIVLLRRPQARAAFARRPRLEPAT